ncbi:MAG: 50S ribosomal protein L10 [Candidatus Paceibacterota bacterium]|jgi:large subunit ribosomal protein L10
MKTKKQKTQDLEKGGALAHKAQALVFVDFSQAPTKEVEGLKRAIDSVQGVYKVIKKRLLGIILKNEDIPIGMEQFEGQLATIFSEKDISDTAGTVYQFLKGKAKEFPAFRMVGGYDMASKTFFDVAAIEIIGKLPSRDVLLAQFVGLLSTPTRSLVHTLDQIAKKKSA